MSAVLDQPKTTNLTDLRKAPAPEAHLPAVRADFFNLQGFELLQRVAKAFASSSLVPEHYRGNLPNCMIALNLARRMKADELMVMQNLYVVHGNPGWSSKFLIACVNTGGDFSKLRYEWRNTENPSADTYGCRAWAIEKETGERLNGVWIDWKMVKAEKWNEKNGSKWKTMADQMFVYRAAAFWQRAYAPEISMGLNTAEELGDVYEASPDGAGRYSVTTEDLRTAGEIVDKATGEIGATQAGAPIEGEAQRETGAEAPAGDGAPTIVYEDLLKALQTAEDQDTLDAKATLIGMVDGADRQNTLAEAFKARRAELQKPKAAKK